MKRKWVYGCLAAAAALLMAGCGAGQTAVIPNPDPVLQKQSEASSNIQKEQVPKQAQPQLQEQIPVQSPAQASQVQVPAQPQSPVYPHNQGSRHHGRSHHADQASAVCHQCYGSGQCPTCHGSGSYQNAVCPNCTGQHGSCGACNGTGYM